MLMKKCDGIFPSTQTGTKKQKQSSDIGGGGGGSKPRLMAYNPFVVQAEGSAELNPS